jgi:hypothetical protein
MQFEKKMDVAIVYSCIYDSSHFARLIGRFHCIVAYMIVPFAEFLNS